MTGKEQQLLSALVAAMRGIDLAVEWLLEQSALTTQGVLNELSEIQVQVRPVIEAQAREAALLERIDSLAQAGICQMTGGGKHAFLKDIRAAIAAAKGEL